MSGSWGSTMAEAAASSRRWLFGPWPDLLFGCGFLYLAVVLAFVLWGPELRAEQAATTFPLLILAASLPHYGATLLRVYERRDDRRLYQGVALWGSLVLLAGFVAALFVPLLGSLLATLYLTWSPWHYSRQNYGIGLMFLRRRGVAPDDAAKRWLHRSFLFSTALVFLAMNTGSRGPDGITPQGADIHFLSLGIPGQVTGPIALGVAAAYLLASGIAFVRLRARAERLADLGPMAAIALVQALWFSIPLGLPLLGVRLAVDPLRPDLRGYYFTWIAVGHAVQYLWITAYYARASTGFAGYGAWFGKTLVAGTAAWVVPVVLFAPAVRGSLSFDSGLELLVASMVNLHHFVLDGAIWKLRAAPVARILVDHERDTAPAAAAVARLWPRRLLWGTLALALGVRVFWIYNQEVVFRKAIARGDYAAASAVWDRLAWLGYEDSTGRLQVALALEQKHPAQAAEEYRRSAELRPSVAALAGLAISLTRIGRVADAREAYDRALALAPDDPILLSGAGTVALRLGDVARAKALLARADQLRPGDAGTLAALRAAAAIERSAAVAY
jgi:tetratricopeptide (TPR) repeat protein